ncbi:OmpA family protein [Bermanella marisrubri]|uniref:OmpA family protein n=1 Tax=Bermanella marisrubri TaxID=207949 RepID=Q1N4F6_9GAMM|nr:phosphate ABC transporter substrate-binding/OmpA family protein [Bermanella marisrubri]EAT13151.1 OmpA family protein [Oceanobacter sp. RED65] [Bermanella marisrubri]QIZ83925.1 OmpA family protein [Bermanella marisrubri]
MKYSLLFLFSWIFSSFVFASLSVEQEARLNQSLSEILVKPAPFEALVGSSEKTLFSIQGSNTIGGSLAPNLAMEYLKAKGAKNVMIRPLPTANEKLITGDLPDQGKSVNIFIAAHGSSTGFKKLVDGQAQIWAASRPVKDKEVKAAQPLANLRAPESEHVLGIDGLAIIVNPDNPVSQLSKEQVGLIYSGQISNWSQLGGQDRAITLYARDNKSGTWDSFKSMVLAKRFTLSSDAFRYESSEDLVDSVLTDPSGIGFVGLGFVKEAKLVAISDGPAQPFQPSIMTVATEDYALSRRLFLYTPGASKNKYVNEFLAFAEGIQGQRVVNAEGYISQNVEAMDVALPDELPQDYLAMVKNAKRLSINFRFKEGSAKLDNKALKDIQRLAYYMTEHPQQELVLIGFGDRRKNKERSKLLSKLRAMAVRRELSRLGIYPDEAEGYGEYNPVAAFEQSAATKNRRVEVWLR